MTYDFRCNSCKKRFEKVMTFKEYDSKKVKCPHCKSKLVKRTYPKPAEIRFKGAGFFVNDSKGR